MISSNIKKNIICVLFILLLTIALYLWINNNINQKNENEYEPGSFRGGKKVIVGGSKSQQSEAQFENTGKVQYYLLCNLFHLE